MWEKNKKSPNLKINTKQPTWQDKPNTEKQQNSHKQPMTEGTKRHQLPQKKTEKGANEKKVERPRWSKPWKQKTDQPRGGRLPISQDEGGQGEQQL